MRIILPSLHPNQYKIAVSTARFRVVVCGRRWGKTRLGIALSLQYASVGKRVWWIAPVYQTATIAFRLMQKIAQQIPGCMVRIAERVIYLPTGGEIWIKSADRPNNLRGEGIDFAVFDEADYQPESVWTNVIRPALADRAGHALFISTPRVEGSWFHKLFQLGQDAANKEWESYNYPSHTNPYLPLGEIEAAKRDMPLLEFDREFLALFVVAPGAVYSTFTSANNVGEFRYNDKFPLYVGVDFNYGQIVDAPMSAVFMQKLGEHFFVVGEIQERGTTYQHVDRMLAWLNAHSLLDVEGRPISGRVITIPDATGKTTQHTGTSNHAILQANGFKLWPPAFNPLVVDRDNAVNARIANKLGEYRLHIDSSCKKTIEGFTKLEFKGRDMSQYGHLTSCVGYVIHKCAPVRRPYETPIMATPSSLNQHSRPSGKPTPRV